MSAFRVALKKLIGLPYDSYDDDMKAFRQKYGPYERTTVWVRRKKSKMGMRVLRTTPLWREFREQRMKERGE